MWTEAQADYKAGEYETAREKLLELTKRNPSHEEAFRLLAKVAEARWDYYEASVNWRKVRELNGLDHEAKEHLAESLLIDRQHVAILKLYEQDFQANCLEEPELLAYAEAVLLAGDKSKRTVVLERVRETVDDEIQIDYLDGLQKIRSGDYDGGLALLEKITEHQGIPKMFRWRLEVMAGGVLSYRGKISQAEAHYLQAHAIAPKMTNHLLGEFYRVNGMLAKSIEFWKLELEAQPQNDYARMQMIEIYGGMGDKAHLLELRKTLQPIDRSKTELCNYADAVLLFLDKDYEASMKMLKKCLCYFGREFYHVIRLCGTLELGTTDDLENDMAFLRQKTLDKRFVTLVTGRLYDRLQNCLKANDTKTAIWYAELIWSFNHLKIPEMQVVAKLLMAERYEKREFTDALELGAFCLSYDAEDKEVLRVMVMSSLGTSQFTDCLSYAKRLGENDMEAQSACGNALAFIGSSVEAADVFEHLLQQEPDNMMLREYAWRFYRELGMEDRMKKVERMYDGGDGMDKVRQACLQALHLLWKGEQKSFSVKAHEILMTMIPGGENTNPELRYWHAVIMLWSGMHEKAIVELKDVLRMGYSNASVLCELSEAYAKRGAEVEALDIAQGAAKLWPGWYVVDRCLRRREKEIREMKIGMMEQLDLERKLDDGRQVENIHMDDKHIDDREMDDKEMDDKHIDDKEMEDRAATDDEAAEQ